MRILIAAYACRPGTDADKGAAWRIPLQLAERGKEVVVLTCPDARPEIELELSLRPRAGLSFEYIGKPAWGHQLGFVVGGAVRHLMWQWRAADAAKRLHAREPFDIVHEIPTGTILGGSFLWQVDAAFVFGPSAGEWTAPGFGPSAGEWTAPVPGASAGERTAPDARQSLLRRILWRLDWPARRTARAALILTADDDAERLVRRLGGRHIKRLVDGSVESIDLLLEQYEHLLMPDYEKLNAQQLASEHDDYAGERYAQFARRLPLGPLQVLDAGCNVGTGAGELKRLRPESEIIGLDVICERLARLPRDVYTSTVCADARRLPLEDASLDAVVAGQFIEHLAPAHVDTVLREFWRVLRPGGVLLLTASNPHGLSWYLHRRSPLDDPSHLTAHEPCRLRRRLLRLGFSQIELTGSGRMTRRIGEKPVLALYRSYLVRAVRA